MIYIMIPTVKKRGWYPVIPWPRRPFFCRVHVCIPPTFDFCLQSRTPLRSPLTPALKRLYISGVPKPPCIHEETGILHESREERPEIIRRLILRLALFLLRRTAM